MNNDQYMEMLNSFADYFDPIVISWSNGLKVKCRNFTCLSETSLEPGDDDYVGEYTVGVDEVEILEEGNDNSVEIYNDSIEISLACIPERITSEDGTVLWQRSHSTSQT